MAIPLIFAAIILFVAAFRNQLGYLATNIETDVKGFFPWLVAVLTIAAIGLIPKAKPISYALLGLVFLVLLIANKGFFTNLQNITPTAPPAGDQPTTAGAAKAETPAAGPGVQVAGSGSGSGASAGGSGGGLPASAGGGNVVSFPGVPDFTGLMGSL